MIIKLSALFVLFGFFMVLLVGTLGYHLIEGYGILDSLYMTVITATTVGFGEVAPLSDAGKIFTIILSIISVSLVFFFFGFVTQAMFVALRSKTVHTSTENFYLPTHDFFKLGKHDKITAVSLPSGNELIGKTKLAVLTNYHILVVAVKDSDSLFKTNVAMDYILKPNQKMLLLASKSTLQEHLPKKHK